MARSKTAAPTDEAVLIETEAVQAGGTALAVQSKEVLALMRHYGVSSCNPAVLEAEIRGHQQTAVEMMFGIGARLLLLREVCAHGEWLPTLERLGMAEASARRIMQATIKFAAPGKARERLLGSTSKGQLLELLTLDDEQIDALEAGEHVGELNLDRVSTMSTSELRREVRKLQADAAGKDKLLANKAKRIDALELEREKRYEPDPSVGAETAEQAEVMHALKLAHLDAINAQAALIRLVIDVRDNQPSEAMVKAGNDALENLAQLMEEAISTNGFLIQFAEAVDPEWTKPKAKKAAR